MLKTCAQSGTAKKLASLDIDIASKTGTVGKPNSKENLDCWNISYTKEQTCGVWLGNLDNAPITYAGGNQPTQIVKDYFSQVEDNSTFITPSSITEKNIDIEELNQNHRVMLANNFMPERYCQKEIFSKFNLPNDISIKFTKIEKPNYKSKVEGNIGIIELDAKDYLTYSFSQNGKVFEMLSGKEGKQNIRVPLENEKEKIELEIFYTIMPETKYNETICLIKTQNKNANEKWFI